MDFSPLDPQGADAALLAEVRAMLAEHLGDADANYNGTGHDDALHYALGARGWLLPERPKEVGGAGLTPLQCELLDLELARSGAPLMALYVTKLTLSGIEQFGDPGLVAELMPKIAAGEVRICLGYSEPDNGSDIAAAKTRAVRDEDEWVINGAKMYTTEAHNCAYSFLITRTSSEGPKHRGLTMFLMPLDADGVEVASLYTVGGERTNVVYFTDARVNDRFRVGVVNEGWNVLRGPLDAEHGTDQAAKEIAMPSIGGRTPILVLERALEAAVVWAAAAGPDGRVPAEDPGVRGTLAEVAIELEAAACTPDPMGRNAASAACIRHCATLLDLIGPQAVVASGAPGALAHGLLEESHRFAQGTSIYGGSVEIFKNMMAQRVLGLPRPLPTRAS